MSQPAFPSVREYQDGGETYKEVELGLSVRAYIATRAMAELMKIRPITTANNKATIAKDAVEMAIYLENALSECGGL